MTNDSLPETLPTPESTPEPAPEAIAEPEAALEPEAMAEPPIEEPTESFADMLTEFERSHSHKGEPGSKTVAGHGRLPLRRPGVS